MNVCYLFVSIVCATRVLGTFTNLKVERTISLSGHLPEVKLACTIRNDGRFVADTYEFHIEPEYYNKISYVIGGIFRNQLTLLQRISLNEKDESHKYIYKLDKPISPGEQSTIFIQYVLHDVLESYPSTIKQSDEHFIRFYFNPLFYSPYKTTVQSTNVHTNTDTIVSYSKSPSPVELKQSNIIYGPYNDQSEFAQQSCMVHCKSSERFIKIKSLNRKIMVSHWGALKVEDRVHLVHIGPKLDHGFSRLEYMQHLPKPTAVMAFITNLPKLTRNIYYRDDIGNISTSSVAYSGSSLSLILRPRYPLFGGWQTIYNTGYDLPSHTYLRKYNDYYKVKLRLIDNIMNDMDVDQLQFKVVLPEKATNILIKTPFSLNYTCDDLTYAYLDTVGRPTCTIQANHLTNFHIQYIEVFYHFENHNIYRKPIYASILIFGLFVIAIIFVRLDFSVTVDTQFENNMKLYAEWDKIRKKMLDVEWTYMRITKAIDKFKKDKNFQDLDNTRKRIEMEFKSCNADISSVVTKLILDNKAYATKYSDFTSSTSKLRDMFRSYVQNAQKYVNGKVTKNAFSGVESDCLEITQALIRKLSAEWQ
ncbi:hypothetical protein GJ496_011881 [Pomphorhynchus laevis]|nr:hypothetical protein GJ496_011881 [Pomphorhynchus laevis]